MSFVELFENFSPSLTKKKKYNPGQNIWQKWRFIPLPPISMLFAPIHVFLREDFPENSNIDIVGGTGVPNN